MKPLSIATAVLSAMLGLTACSSDPPEQETQGQEAQGAAVVATQDGVPGGIAVATYEVSAKITAIDAAERKVTVVDPDDESTTVVAGPAVRNFDQLEVGDQITVTVTEELVVELAGADAAPSDGQATLVAGAPEGAKPGVLVADTVQVTTEVIDIDLEKHEATLKFPSGETETFAVRDDIDLTKHEVGEEVVITMTQAMAISVEKP